MDLFKKPMEVEEEEEEGRSSKRKEKKKKARDREKAKKEGTKEIGISSTESESMEHEKLIAIERKAVEVGEPSGERERSRSESVGSRKSIASEYSAILGASSKKMKRKGIPVEKEEIEKELENDEVTAVESENMMERMRMIGEKMREYVFAESNNVSKSACEFILNRVAEYEECMMKMVCKCERLQGKLEERVQMSSMIAERERRVCMHDGVSVDRVISDRKGREEDNKRISYAAVVRLSDESAKASSEEVKKKIMNEVSKELNVRIKAVRKTRSGAVAIQTVSESELKKITSCKRFGEIGLKVELPRKIGPKIIAYDVPNEMTSECFMKELYERNLKNIVSECEFRERTRVISRNGKKDGMYGNVIVEMSMKCKNAVMNEGRVYVNWSAFKVKEFASVLRCYGCYAHGHTMNNCGVNEKLCVRCGEKGHIGKACKKSECCRNCKMKGVNSGHSVLSDKCPEYVNAMMRMKERINYD